MSSDTPDHDRADRDRDRSQEAHWQVAEAGAEKEKEEEERLPGAARQSERQQTDWEDDGGAFDPDQ